MGYLARQGKERRQGVKHVIKVTIEIETTDDNAMIPTDNPLGIMMARKAATFFGYGRSLEEITQDVGEKVAAFLLSDGAKVGSEKTPRLVQQ